MKKIYNTFLVLVFSVSGLFAQDNNMNVEEVFGKISFYNGDYEKYMEAGAKQDKPLMLLFCRQECHTCNYLKRGMKKTDVGSYFNRYFFSFFVDTEKEKFKLFPLSEKYKITSTPFFVFMTPDGKIIYKGSIHPEKDSVLETCTQILTRYISYKKIAEDIKLAVLPHQQMEVAEKLVEKFKFRLETIDSRTILSQVFMTYNLKNYKVFNETFIKLAEVYQKPSNGEGLFKVDDVASNKQQGGNCGKRASKWQKWAE